MKPNGTRGEDANASKQRARREGRAWNLEDAERERVEPPGEASSPFSAPRIYTLADLDADRRRELLSLANLPEGHGWGTTLDRLAGGGLGPGDVVAVGASTSGAGKTALVMGWADGLGLRSANLAETDRGGPLTPMILLSEMHARALAWRTLARLVGAPAWFFRSGQAAFRWKPEEAAAAYEKARAMLAPGGLFQRIAPWQRMARPESRGVGVFDLVAVTVDAMRKEVVARHPGREVWPVVVIDPIQRWQDGSLPEVEALNQLSERLDELADAGGWVVFLTSDTNKTAAVGREEKDRDPANLFRGSYKLFHSSDLVLASEPQPYVEGEPTRRVRVGVAKNRNGGMGSAWFTWELATGRFTPVTAPEPGEPVKSAPKNGSSSPEQPFPRPTNAPPGAFTDLG